MNKILLLAMFFSCAAVAADEPAAADPSSGSAPQAFTLQALEQSPFFARDAKRLRQNLRLKVANAGGATSATLTSQTAGESLTRQVSVAPGESWLDLPVPEVAEPTSVTVTLSATTATATREGTIEPQRKWSLYLAPSIHTDIGYTNTQPEVFKRFNANLDSAMELCRRDPTMKWNAEVAWEIQNYFADRPATATQELVEFMKEGRIGLHAGYLNELTALLSDEAMNRIAYFANDLRRQYGMDTSSAVLTDVPTPTRAFASALSASGVRYFANGSNPTRAPILRLSGIREPFYWEGPDGARVLMWLTESYAQSLWLARSQNLRELEDNVARVAKSHQRPNYPYDSIYVYGAFFDNEPVDPRYGAMLDDWQKKWEYPKLIVCRTPEFFSHLEAKYGEKIPVRRGDFGAYWEDGAGSTAQETAMHLANQRRVTAAETLWSLARLRGSEAAFPKERFAKVWENILFYAEHTWGAAQSISDPDGEMTRKQWNWKANYARHAAEETPKLMDEALKAFVSTVPAAEGELVVVNPLSWERSGLVEVPNDKGFATLFIHDDQGKRHKAQRISGKMVFVAEKVPAFGSRKYRMEWSSAGGGLSKTPELSTAYYTVSLDKERGIIGITDMETGKQLIDATSPYQFGQLLYVSGGEDSSLLMDNSTTKPQLHLTSAAVGTDLPKPAPGTLLLSPARVTKITAPQSMSPFVIESVISSTAPTMPEIKTRIRLYTQEKRIELDVRITSKTENRAKEAVYIAFPFAMKDPKFRLGMTNAVSDPAKDFELGACNEWYCVQDFVSCRAAEGGPEVIWSSPDAPLVSLSQINLGRWPAQPELTTGTIFSYVMNNYWFTNYKAGQGGDFRFRYNLTSASDGASNEQGLRFSRGAATPLLAAVSPGIKGGAAEPPLQVSGAGVVGVTLKPAHHEEGTIIRLRNTEAQPASAVIQLANDKAALHRVNLVEEKKPDSEAVAPTVLLKPQETATLLLTE